ncbi:MAG: glutamate--tRNA ligase [Pseudomonadota bacterium]
MTIRVRFAPSPTGYLHIGNVRTALVTWLCARHSNGEFLLRIDDTDAERSEERYVDAIQEDLGWLGLDWDLLARQSERTARYDQAIEDLKGSGRLYPCYETPEELSLKRKSALQQGKPPLYDRAALALSNDDRARLEAAGRRPHWRFKLDHEPIEWVDLVRGQVRFNGADMSDPVLIREDGRPLYHISSVVDDIAFEISHVVRGEDHVANTAAHIQMIEALGGTPPSFAHLPLLADAAGKGLSKRLDSLGIRELREVRGVEPLAIVSMLARLGTSDPVEPFTSIRPLINGFDFAKFARATPKFDPAELDRLNARILHALSFEEARPRLNALGFDEIDEAFWLAVRPNLEIMADVGHWYAIARGPIERLRDDPAFLDCAAELLPDEPWDAETWKLWTNRVKEATGAKGKALFLPLRRALTGQDHGPELAALLPLMGRDRAVRRLTGAPSEALT